MVSIVFEKEYVLDRRPNRSTTRYPAYSVIMASFLVRQAVLPAPRALASSARTAFSARSSLLAPTLSSSSSSRCFSQTFRRTSLHNRPRPSRPSRPSS
ncbi:hypothetical protein IMZ48_30955 [Candidatus Bathyarchaeota archaeon]|nr:hypothetical protein [Candidatus Bathyarchaeota archaeon]